MLGIGGGFIFVPLLIYLFPHVGIHGAIATSTCFTVFAGLSSYISHASFYSSMKRILFWVLSGSILGAVLGPHIALATPGRILSRLFAVIVTLPFVMRQMKVTLPDRPWLLSLTGFFIGVISSTFGIGGGVVLMPLLTQAFHKDIRESITTSSLFIVINSSIGTAVYALSGTVVWKIILVAAPAGILGARLGAKLSRRTPPLILNLSMAALVILIIIKMLGVE